MVEISVEDTGVGISSENQGKLFKLFGFIQDSSQMNTQGIGLGLAIAEQIVSKFKGHIKVKSELGEGSIFTFSFRLQPEERNLVDDQSEEENYVNRDTLFFEWRAELE